MNIEIMRNTLYKAYLEDFYKFCEVRPLVLVQVRGLSSQPQQGGTGPDPCCLIA